MNKTTMIRNYRTMSAADSYLIGFSYKHNVYMVKVAEIMPRMIKVERASHKNGGMLQLKFRPLVAHKEQLIRKGAELIGTEEEVYALNKNKGCAFEKYCTERFTTEAWVKDSIPFYVQGDIEVNGEQIQIKFEGAEITNERVLRNARKALKALA